MMKVTYRGALSDKPVTEYLCVLHDGITGERAREYLRYMARQADVELHSEDMYTTCKDMSMGTPPKTVKFKKSGKFHRILERNWS